MRKRPYSPLPVALQTEASQFRGRRGLLIVRLTFVRLGLLEYFNIELTIAKILGVLAMVSYCYFEKSHSHVPAEAS